MPSYDFEQTLPQKALRASFGPAVQLSLIPDDQCWAPWVIRLHHATRLHYDLRFAMMGTLLSFALDEVPSLDPGKWVKARRMGDHDPKHLLSERRIPKGQPGAGPTMPVDTGTYAPVVELYSTHDLEMLHQLGRGDMYLLLQGRHMQGLWRLWGTGEHWRLAKMPDEFASTTRELTLDVSIKTGKRLSDL